ncbi:PREDICTED: PRUPE_2G155700, partial [Prunus dulcis]
RNRNGMPLQLQSYPRILRLCILSSHREGRNASTTIGCLEKGYVGLEDQLEETMPGEEIYRSLLWKKAREDKQGNIPDPKVAEKAKLI